MTALNPGSIVQNGHTDEAKAITLAEKCAPDLRKWKLSVAKAERANRNLRQGAASIAAVLGIGAGGGGMLALAQAVTKEPKLSDFAVGVILVAGAVALGLFLALGSLVISAFLERHRAESEADEHLSVLIENMPDVFLPHHGED